MSMEDVLDNNSNGNGSVYDNTNNENENELCDDLITESLDLFDYQLSPPSSSFLSEVDASELETQYDGDDNDKRDNISTTTATTRYTPKPTKNYSTTSNNKKTPRTPKPIPPFKIIQGTEFLVDGFQYKNPHNKHYFLTHFHSDHYVGITKGFNFGNIYCSEITARLLKLKLGVNSFYIKEIPLNTLVTIEGVEVMFLDANHCPGSVLILFRNVDNGKNILHTGDFRYHPNMQSYEGLLGVKVDTLYLDTTFCDPRYTFPPQKDVIQSIVDIVIREILMGPTLFLIGTYVIGKERIFLEISKKCKVKIFVVPDKYAILNCLDMDMNVFTTSSNETNVHVVPMGFINFKSMKGIGIQNSQYKKIVGFLPTGWSQSPKTPITKKQWDNVTIYNVAYSEHSSFDELKECVKWLKPSLIVPTVDCGSQESIDKQLAHFNGLTDDTNNFKTIIPYLFGLAKKSLSFGGSSSPSSSTTTSSQQTYIPHIKEDQEEKEKETKKEKLDSKKENCEANIDQSLKKSVEDKLLLEESELIDFSYVDPKILSQQRWIEKCIVAENNKKSGTVVENKSKRRASMPSSITTTNNTKQTPTFNSTSKKKALENKNKNNKDKDQQQQIIPFTPNNNNNNNKKIKMSPSYPQTPTPTTMTITSDKDKENLNNNENNNNNNNATSTLSLLSLSSTQTTSSITLRQTNILSFFSSK